MTDWYAGFQKLDIIELIIIIHCVKYQHYWQKHSFIIQGDWGWDSITYVTYVDWMGEFVILFDTRYYVVKF